MSRIIKRIFRRVGFCERLEDRRLLSYTPSLIYNFPASPTVQTLFANSDGSVTYVTNYDIERDSPGATPTVVATFGDEGTEPNDPQGIDVQNSAGDIFGATTNGGVNGTANGALYEESGGTITTLASFRQATTGWSPLGVYLDRSGNIFGANSEGGADNNGVVWEYHAATHQLSDVPIPASFGAPNSNVVVDTQGDIFGATRGSTASSPGVIYEIAARTAAVTSAVFDAAQGYGNGGELTIDTGGDVFGTSSAVGSRSPTFQIYELAADDHSTVKSLATVSGNGDGVVRDSAGDLFGSLAIASPDRAEFYELPAGGSSAQLIASLSTATLGTDTFAFALANDGTIYGANQDGGASGGGTLFSLTPGGADFSLNTTLARTNLPAAVVSGSAIKDAAVVDITNTATTELSATETINVMASASGLADINSIVIGTLTKKLAIKPGATIAVAVPIKSVPASLVGTYTLFSRVTDTVGDVANSAAGPTLTAAAPFVAFTDSVLKSTLPASVVSGIKTKAQLSLQIVNNGNVVSTGFTTIALYASPDQSATSGTLIRSLLLKVAIKPGKAARVNVPLLAIPALANNNYYIVAQVTDPLNNITSTSAASPATIAAPYIQLSETVALTGLAPTIVAGAKTAAAATIDIVNAGNIAFAEKSILTYSFVEQANPGVAVAGGSEPVAISISAGGSRNLRIALKRFPSALASGVTYNVQVEFTQPGGTITSGTSSQTILAT